MATPQAAINDFIPGISSVGLALNIAGIINNKKNVAIYIINDKGGKQDIFETTLGRIGDITGVSALGYMQDPAIIDCEVMETSKLAEHPLEDGRVRADNKVKMPAEISVKIAMPAADYKDSIAKIQRYKDDNQMLCVETKYGVFENMQIVSIPCSLNVENIDRVTFTLKLREVLIAQDINNMNKNNVANASDSDTQNTGFKSGLNVESNFDVINSWI